MPGVSGGNQQEGITIMATFHPMKGDGSRTRLVLSEIRAGRLKGDMAKRLLQQARVDDAKEAAATTEGGQP